MRVTVHINESVEVDVPVADLFDGMHELPEPERVPTAMNGLGSALGYIKRVPVEIIGQMTEPQRVNIAAMLEKEAGRYLTCTSVPFSLTGFGPEHPLVKVAEAMVAAHRDWDTMIPAIEDVREQFPDLSFEHAALLWIGVNARDRS